MSFSYTQTLEEQATASEATIEEFFNPFDSDRPATLVTLGQRINFDGRIEVCLIDVTPELAQQILERNFPNNRSRSPARIDNYASDMLNDRWSLNGATIVRDRKTGRLINGQHRLAAVVKAGITVPFLVVWTDDENAFATLDIGKSRSGGDILKIAGFKYGKNVSSIANLVADVEAGVVGRQGQVPKSELVDFVEARPGLEEAAAFLSGIAKLYKQTNERGLVRPAVIGCLYYFWSKADKDRAKRLLRTIGVGVDPDNPDPRGSSAPAYVLNEKLRNDVKQKRTRPDRVYLHLFQKCWDMDVENKKATGRSFPADPRVVEHVPNIAGANFNFSALRARTGLTGAALAEKLNVSQPQISNWDNGAGSIPKQTIKNIFKLIREHEKGKK